MREESFQGLSPGGFHRIAYREWGSQDNQRVLVCVHGLARNSRDFDELAHVLARSYRVVCPDMVGRGDSDWLPAGGRYEITQYVNDMVALLARLNVKQVDWLGTSMGGIIGMALAAQPQSPIRRLVLNDIGAFVSRDALQRIGSYVGTGQTYDDLEQATVALQTIYPSFNGISRQQWQHLAMHGTREQADGRLAAHYDPQIGEQTRANADTDIDLWPLWRAVTCPQLLLWGDVSDVLTAETVTDMCKNPRLTLSRWPGVAHPPSLMVPEQIKVVADWLRSPDDAIQDKT